MIDIPIDGRDEFQQRFSKVSGDPFMGQRRAKMRWMAGSSQLAVGPDAQCFTLNAATNTFQGVRVSFQPESACDTSGIKVTSRSENNLFLFSIMLTVAPIPCESMPPRHAL